MNADTRREIIEAAHAREVELIDTKGREYTGGAEQGNDLDTLANFKRVAERTGLNALQVWGVYFLKHVDAISTYLQDPTRQMSEPITGRIDDARTYLGLLECLLVDLDPVQERNEKPAFQLLVKVERGACPCGAGSKGDGHVCNLLADPRPEPRWTCVSSGNERCGTAELCSYGTCPPEGSECAGNHAARAAEADRNVEARTPRRCGTCGDPVIGSAGLQVRTNDRTTNYCNDECARHGERRLG